MKIEKVSQRLSERSTSDKIEYTRNVVTSMTGNSNFTTPNPALASITTAVNNVETANIAAADGGKSKHSFLEQQETVLDNLLSQLGNYVEATANAAAAAGGDAQAVILSAGMDFKRAKNKAPLPLAPGGLTGTSLLEGDVDLKWKSVKYARAYVIEISDDVTAITGGGTISPTTGSVSSSRVFITWAIADIATKCKITISGLNSGTKYAFSVYAIGTAGKGTKSVPVVVKVL